MMRELAAGLSVVVPIYQEEEGVEHFARELLGTLQGLGTPFQVVFVDDGSRDGTLPKLRAFARANPSVNVVSLSRNYGHQIALLAGLDRARGEAIVTMDGDLQHPPSYIPRMLEKWREGFDVVNMYRVLSGREGLWKMACTKFFYWFFNKVSSFAIHPAGSDFRLFDRRVLRAVREFRQQQFFLRGIVAEVGFPTTHIEYLCPQRRFGQPSYNFRKLVDLALRGLLSYSTIGLKVPLYLGLLLFAVSCSNIAYGLYKLARGVPIPEGWLTLFSVATMGCAVLCLFLGVQGFYIARIYAEVRRQPLYCVKEQWGIPGDDPAS